MKLGVLKEVKPKLQQLRDMLSQLGTVGKIKIEPTLSGPKVVDITTDVQITVHAPCVIHYQITEEGCVLQFERKLPMASWKGFNRNITQINITLSRIDIKINWSPDGYFEVIS